MSGKGGVIALRSAVCAVVATVVHENLGVVGELLLVGTELTGPTRLLRIFLSYSRCLCFSSGDSVEKGAGRERGMNPGFLALRSRSSASRGLFALA